VSIKTSLSSDSNASEIVSFRIPRARHNLLALRARERGKKSPDLLAKEVILNYLMGKPENLLETALTNVHAGQKKLYRRLHALSELFVFWLTSWYAHHPDLPETQKAEASRRAEERHDNLLSLFKEEVYLKAPDLFDAILADYVETDAEGE
jgi:hypothetical protein